MGKIGIFDSGYGGLTVLRAIVDAMPEYSYVYLGDNSRAPYGDRSFEVVHEYTLQCTEWLFNHDCDLVILACNTASAKALRQIQQFDLPKRADSKRVLGVIRPTTEKMGDFTETKHIGIVGTKGTVQSNSYQLEIHHFFPDVHIYQEACPIWVHLVENELVGTAGSDFFVKYHLDRLLEKSPDIDTLLLACTHYPLLHSSIQKFLPPSVRVISQGPVVAESLQNYLKRHNDFDSRLSRKGGIEFYTSDSNEDFDTKASKFFTEEVRSQTIHL
jgi:glutamate racemase